MYHEFPRPLRTSSPGSWGPQADEDFRLGGVTKVGLPSESESNVQLHAQGHLSGQIIQRRRFKLLFTRIQGEHAFGN